MANELVLAGTSGQTVYVMVRNVAGGVYNGSAFEAQNTSNLAAYKRALAEDASTGVYFGTFPSLSVGRYSVEYRVQSGGSPAWTDAVVAWEPIDWSGTAVVGAAIGGNVNVASIAGATASGPGGGSITFAATVGTSDFNPATDGVTVEAIDADAIDADALSDAAIGKLLDEFWQRPDLHDGTCQAGSTGTTIVLDANASTENDHYNGVYLLTTGGTGADQRAIIVDYVGSERTATIDRTWSVAPDATTTYVFDGLAASDLDEEAIRDAIGLDDADLGDRLDAIPGLTWDEARSDHDDAGTFGEALQIEDGTCQEGSTTGTIVLASTAVGSDDYYNDQEVLIVSGSGTGQSRRIVGYDGEDRTANVDRPWAIVPNAASKYRLQGAAPGGMVDGVVDKNGFVLASGGLDQIAIESGVNARQALSPILAAAAGALSGAGTGTIVIKGGNVSTTRITATTAGGGNRTGVSLNLPE